jgi:hypothetical protein
MILAEIWQFLFHLFQDFRHLLPTHHDRTLPPAIRGSHRLWPAFEPTGSAMQGSDFALKFELDRACCH